MEFAGEASATRQATTGFIHSLACNLTVFLVEGIMPPYVFLSPSSVSCEGSFAWFVAD
jgi:hypothetical protein